MSAHTTALCGRRPPIDFQHRADTLMALVFKLSEKLTKGEVGDLFSPQAFHTRKVEVFKEQYIKTTAQVYREFPMMVCSLVRRFLVDTCNVLTFSFLILRTFDLTRIRLLCSCQRFSVVFVEHRRGISMTITAEIGKKSILGSKSSFGDLKVYQMIYLSLTFARHRQLTKGCCEERRMKLSSLNDA